MEKYFLQTVGAQILAETGQKLGRVSNIIVNTENGSIIGFQVGSSGRKVIVPMDILSWSSFIRVHDAHDVIDIHEVHKVEETADKKIPVYKNRVVTKSGEYVGQVIDYGMDNKLFKLSCIIVARSFLGFIFWDKKIIAAADIIEIKKKKNIIKNLVKPVKMKKLRVDMASTS